MRFSRTWGAFGVAAIATVLLTGCTVADAASPARKNTPRPTVTTTPTENALPTPTVETPVTEEPSATPVDEVPPPFSWGEVNGTWCTGDQQLCFTMEGSAYEMMGELYVAQATGADFGCFQGTVTHHTYEGAHLLYCPANTPTPFALINPAATTAEEAVYRDDASRDRLWLYNGVGPVTYFRQ